MKLFRKRSVIYYREGPEWIEKIRLYISTNLLNVAERIPKVKAGYWHNLQRIREWQRKEANDDFERYQIPKDTNVILLGFQLVELFHFEDFGKLKTSLRALFPDSHRLHRRDFERFHGDISFGGWQRQGYFVPTNSSRFIPGEDKAIVEKLSPDISYIELFTHQVTPSLIALTFHVRLTDDAKTKFVEFFDKKYLFPTKLGWYRKKLGDLPTSGTGFLNSGVETEFSNWSETLQINVEKNIREYFPGYFNAQVIQKTKLPRIDIFVIDKPSVDESKETDEKASNNKKQNQWKRSLGLDVY